MSGLLLSRAQWRKSSHSGGQGTDCVEVAAVWRKSSHSGSQGTGCVEVATVPMGRFIAVRDSKNPDGPVLAFNSSEWSTLLGAIKSGDLGRSTP